MTDVGWTEMFLLAVIALLIIGPERLPRVAQRLGLWVGRARGAWMAIRGDFEREMRKVDAQQQVLDQQTMQEVRETVAEVKEAVQPPATDALANTDSATSKATSPASKTVAKPPAGDAS